MSVCIYTSGQLVFLLEPKMVNMPDLSDSEQISEQRKVIKFWIDYCHNLEEKIASLEAKLEIATGEK